MACAAARMSVHSVVAWCSPGSGGIARPGMFDRRTGQSVSRPVRYPVRKALPIARGLRSSRDGEGIGALRPSVVAWRGLQGGRCCVPQSKCVQFGFGLQSMFGLSVSSQSSGTAG